MEHIVFLKKLWILIYKRCRYVAASRTLYIGDKTENSLLSVEKYQDYFSKQYWKKKLFWSDSYFTCFKENYIIRPEYGEGKLEVILQADIKEQEENYNTIQQEIQLEVKERKYTEEEWIKECEEAGTKLLFPMMIMLVIVFIIILVPAFISFRG